jgi:hypothetical protein
MPASYLQLQLQTRYEFLLLYAVSVLSVYRSCRPRIRGQARDVIVLFPSKFPCYLTCSSSGVQVVLICVLAFVVILPQRTNMAAVADLHSDLVL